MKEMIVLAPNANKLSADTNVLLHDAHVLLYIAAALTAQKAGQVRQQAAQLLGATALRARAMQACAIDACKEMGASTDAYVHKHPWRAIATGAGVGFAAGLILRRIYRCSEP